MNPVDHFLKKRFENNAAFRSLTVFVRIFHITFQYVKKS